MAKGADLISVTMMRIDGEEGDARPRRVYKLKKMVTVGAIKERNQLEFSIDPEEQVILFRGQRIERDDRSQPLCTPDLQDIIEEAGEDGLRMSVAYHPRRLPDFMEAEKVEEINERFPSGGTLLHRAARRIELSVMEELLHHKEFELLNAVDQSGHTVLHTSALCWNREACEIMLQHKKFEPVNAADEEGRTILHLAACWGDVHVTKMVLEHKLFFKEDITKEDTYGLTALAYARDSGHEGVVELITKALAEDEEGANAPT